MLTRREGLLLLGTCSLFGVKASSNPRTTNTQDLLIRGGGPKPDGVKKLTVLLDLSNVVNIVATVLKLQDIPGYVD